MSLAAATREPQYSDLVEARNAHGLESLGLMTSHAWGLDPKRIGYTWARYNFVAKMLSGRQSVLEVGCGDAFFSRVVKQEVDRLSVVDFDPVFIADVRARMHPSWPMDCAVHDMRTGSLRNRYDGLYALDVLEHIDPGDEARFLRNCVSSMFGPGSVAIFGMPSSESQKFASEISRAGHVNCKSGPELKQTLSEFFSVVLMFSMNDAVIHTGFHGMAHYLLAVCCERR